MKHVRLFAAIPLPDEIKEAAAAMQQSMRRVAGDGIAWTNAQQMHLTLVFLGNVSAERVTSVARALAGACERFPPLRLRLGSAGAFPNARAPRLVWLGIATDAGEPNGALSALQRAVRFAVLPFMQQVDDQRFSPHVTLGRVRRLERERARRLARLLENSETVNPASWVATAVVLFESTLGPQGARHDPVAVLPLAGRL